MDGITERERSTNGITRGEQPMDAGTLLPDGAELEYDQREECHRVDHDWGDERPSTVVVAAVAIVSETDPLELPPLREALDPDALDNLFAPTYGGRVRKTGRVEFEFDDHQVVVDATGEIDVHPPE